MPRSSLHRWLVVAMVALLAAACGSEDSQSPLATWDSSKVDAVAPAIAGGGTLEISARCVRLIGSNMRTVLPVWPEPTFWNASSQVIEFVSAGVRGERLELRDGDQIVLGGVTVQEGSDPPFVSPPDPSCKADETVIVTTVGLGTA